MLGAVELTVSLASASTEVLLVNAPYPGRLKFEGMPTSLLYAATPLAYELERRGSLEKLGCLNPSSANEQFYRELESVLRSGQVRVLCVSSSTAAIEETQRIVALARSVCGERLFIVAGGPHEDDCAEKIGQRMAEVDLSGSGSGESLLRSAIPGFLSQDLQPQEFVRSLASTTLGGPASATLSSRWLDREEVAFRANGAIGPLSDSPRISLEVLPRFEVLGDRPVMPVMVSMGCAFGQCSFCAEALAGGVTLSPSFGGLLDWCQRNRGAAVYFQDSIFPMTTECREVLLPMLRECDIEWGCQVYFPMLSEASVRLLAESGCRYLYTGLESADPEILADIGKPGLTEDIVLSRASWLEKAGLQLGISLMLGSIGSDGAVLEDGRSLERTRELLRSVRATGVEIAGVYPNVETVLPGTQLAARLNRLGHSIDFYQMPRCEPLDELEDGGVGYNFATLGLSSPRVPTSETISLIGEFVTSLREERLACW